MADPMKWFLARPLWQRLTIAAVIFVPFATWIVWLNVNHEDDVVWADNAKVWDKVPITVYAEDFSRATKSAVDIWNGSAGCTVLALTDDKAAADITVKSTDGTPCGELMAPGMLPNHAGGAYLCGDKGEAHIAYPGDLRQQLVVVGHEVGHLLGFGDDDTGCRLMRGSVEAVLACEIIYPSDSDRKALRARYCE